MLDSNSLLQEFGAGTANDFQIYNIFIHPQITHETKVKVADVIANREDSSALALQHAGFYLLRAPSFGPREFAIAPHLNDKEVIRRIASRRDLPPWTVFNLLLLCFRANAIRNNSCPVAAQEMVEFFGEVLPYCELPAVIDYGLIYDIDEWTLPIVRALAPRVSGREKTNYLKGRIYHAILHRKINFLKAFCEVHPEAVELIPIVLQDNINRRNASFLQSMIQDLEFWSEHFGVHNFKCIVAHLAKGWSSNSRFHDLYAHFLLDIAEDREWLDVLAKELFYSENTVCFAWEWLKDTMYADNRTEVLIFFLHELLSEYKSHDRASSVALLQLRFEELSNDPRSLLVYADDIEAEHPEPGVAIVRRKPK